MIPLEKLRKIRVVVLDIDGVLTDGRVGYDGERKIGRASCRERV